MGRKRRCVRTQLDATAVINHVRMRGMQGTQEMASVTSGRCASASDVEYIFADVILTRFRLLVGMGKIQVDLYPRGETGSSAWIGMG